MERLRPPAGADVKVGNGSTAAAVRHEQATGGLVSGRTHTAKAQGYVLYLERWLLNTTAATSDARAAPVPDDRALGMGMWPQMLTDPP